MSLSVSQAGRRYGYLRDTADHRDLGMLAAARQLLSATVARVDLEPWCGPVRDQGDEGSCTGHAIVGVREFLARKYEAQYPILSPAFPYYVARQMDMYWAINNRWPSNAEFASFIKANPSVDDTGSYGRSVCRAVNQFGSCRLAEEPYVVGDFAKPPTDEQFAKGLNWKGGAYHRVATVDDMRSCLASGYVCAIGFTVYESFESIGPDGVWKPSLNENKLGGHEVYVHGYDDTKVDGYGAFKVRNSWDTTWGDQGNFWMRYQDAADSRVLMDAWMIHLGKAWG